MERVMPSELPERAERASVPLERAADIDSFLREVEKRAYRIAAVSIRDADEALDIVQDAMIRLVRGYSRRPPEEWRPLFYRILHNRIRDWQRRSTVRRRVFGFLGVGRDEEDEDALASVPGPAYENPLERVAQADAMEALAAALRQLPARQREAFTLRTLEGLDVAGTAAAMGCSDGSVKTHHSRAVARLRELLGEHVS